MTWERRAHGHRIVRTSSSTRAGTRPGIRTAVVVLHPLIGRDLERRLRPLLHDDDVHLPEDVQGPSRERRQ